MDTWILGGIKVQDQSLGPQIKSVMNPIEVIIISDSLSLIHSILHIVYHWSQSTNKAPTTYFLSTKHMPTFLLCQVASCIKYKVFCLTFFLLQTRFSLKKNLPLWLEVLRYTGDIYRYAMGKLDSIGMSSCIKYKLFWRTLRK